MANKKKRIALIIPAYNEASVIGQVVFALKKKLGATSYLYTIIVVDDGSTDATAVEAKNAGAHVIRSILNSGCGGATALGIHYASMNGFDIATTSDADGQHAPNDVVRGIDTLIKGSADLLIGSRLIDATGMSKVKIIGNKGLSLLTLLILGVNSTDSQSGLRVFSRRALESLRWKTSGYEFCSEMLWRAKQLNLRIEEYPIKAIYSDYSKAKGQNNWNGFNIIKSLIKRRIGELIHE